MTTEGRAMMYAEIDYGGGGRAKIWGEFTEETVVRAFVQHANQCFGIRKSIMQEEVLKVEPVDGLPEPWDKMQGAAFVLKHNCGGGFGGMFEDVAVFDADGEKLKSEWD